MLEKLVNPHITDDYTVQYAPGTKKAPNIFDPVMPLLEIIQKEKKRKAFLYGDIYNHLIYSRGKRPRGNDLNIQQ